MGKTLNFKRLDEFISEELRFEVIDNHTRANIQSMIHNSYWGNYELEVKEVNKRIVIDFHFNTEEEATWFLLQNKL